MKNDEYIEYCFKNRDKRECVNYLIKTNIGLVYNKVNKYFSNSANMSFEDLIQAGTIGLWKAIETYNDDKPANFVTYSSVCINNEICMLLRTQQKYDRFKYLSLSYIYDPNNNNSNITLEDMLYDTKSEEYFRNIEIIEIMEQKLFLSEFEKKVINMRLDNKTQKEISIKLGVSQSYISRVMRRCEKKLRNVLRG